MWLLIKERREEAIDVLNYIGKFNGVSDVWRIPDEAVFDEMFLDLTQNVLLTRDDKSAFGKSVTSKHTYYSKSIKELGKKLYAGGLEEDTPKKLKKKNWRTQIHLLAVFICCF